MKKIMILLLTIILLILLDSLQAKLFNNSPIIHKRQYTQEYNSVKYIDKGILVRYYHYNNGKGDAYFNWEPVPF